MSFETLLVGAVKLNQGRISYQKITFLNILNKWPARAMTKLSKHGHHKQDLSTGQPSNNNPYKPISL